MSAFFIDRYPVTYGRYLECWAAGACVDLPSSDELHDPEMADHVLEYSAGNHTEQFCAWDGGRYLPTEAQWEYAGRGPAPRMNRLVWEDDWDGGSTLSERCRRLARDYTVPECQSGLYYTRPGTRSYFGAERLIYSSREVVRDFHLRGWYADPRSLLPDPYQSERVAARVCRGGPSLGARVSRELSERCSDAVSFRCARPDSP